MEISIDREKERFLQFINEEGNNNIVFSGVFGIGKSYFLNKFFNESYEDQYIGIFLSPVNYSVASNEDIFEYIKVDILLQLLSKVPCNFKKTELSLSAGTYFYLRNHLDDFLVSLLNLAEKTYYGTGLIDTLSSFKKEIDKYIDKHSKDEKQEVQSFVQKITSRPGSIYESNLITQIIHNLVEDAKTNMGTNKKVILVIDDLDRIDPEHIFRILNILSVHNDFGNQQEHKFRFDKTILVCDIDNIRNIYRAKYGINVDFNGYIDKFYSKEVYYFHNEEAIIQSLSNLVCDMKIDYEIGFTENNNLIHNIFVSILKSLIEINAINIRTLEKFKFDFCFGNSIAISNNKRYSIKKVYSIAIFELLKRLFGASNDLEEALAKLASEKHPDYLTQSYSKEFLSIFIALADYPHNGFRVSKTIYKYNNKIQYSINNPKIKGFADIPYDNLVITPSDEFEILHMAYVNYTKYFSVKKNIGNNKVR